MRVLKHFDHYTYTYTHNDQQPAVNNRLQAFDQILMYLHVFTSLNQHRLLGDELISCSSFLKLKL